MDLSKQKPFGFFIAKQNAKTFGAIKNFSDKQYKSFQIKQFCLSWY